MSDLSDFDRQLRLAIYQYFAERGCSPSLDALGETLKRSPDEIRRGYQRLYTKRLLVPTPDGDSIRMAPPFSGVETQHRVYVAGKSYHANCAWDSFGIVAALGGNGQVVSRCEQTHDPLTLSLTGSGPAASPWVFHVVVPASQWWKDIVYT